MKNIIALILLFLLCSIASYSQNPYSKKNLEQATIKELNNYLTKAKNLKTTGAVLVIAGPIVGIGGLLLAASNSNLYDSGYDSDGNESVANAGVIMVFGGVCAALIGLPIIANGTIRVKRIKSIINDRSNGISLELSPYTFPNYLSQNNQLGAALKIKF